MMYIKLYNYIKLYKIIYNYTYYAISLIEENIAIINKY